MNVIREYAFESYNISVSNNIQNKKKKILKIIQNRMIILVEKNPKKIWVRKI